jgi:hypothetical protein
MVRADYPGLVSIMLREATQREEITFLISYLYIL